MRNLLVDADFLIDVEKGKERLPREQLFLSVLSLYEFIRGRKDYEDVKRIMESSFVIVSLSNDIILKATEIYRDLREKGEILDERDLLIGASAIVLGIPIKTRNKKHYEKLKDYGLKVED